MHGTGIKIIGVLKFTGTGDNYVRNILKLLSLESLIYFLSIIGIAKKCVRTQEMKLVL